MSISMGLEWHQVGVIASKEFWDRLRNRWVLAVSTVFTVFALAIAYLGTAQMGAVGFHSIDITIASLVSLVIYLVPLISLIMGYDAIVGERERGTLDLLLSMPITRFEVILGKFFGLSGALAFSTLAGFGLAGIVLSYHISSTSLLHYIVFMFSAIAMGMAFISIAVAISVSSSERTTASGLAIAFWFFFILVFDLLLLGVLVLTEGKYGSYVIPYLMLLNPSDIFRIINIFGMDEIKSLYGLATVMPQNLANPLLLAALMGGWIVAPLIYAAWRFK